MHKRILLVIAASLPLALALAAAPASATPLAPKPVGLANTGTLPVLGCARGYVWNARLNRCMRRGS